MVSANRHRENRRNCSSRGLRTPIRGPSSACDRGMTGRARLRKTCGMRPSAKRSRLSASQDRALPSEWQKEGPGWLPERTSAQTTTCSLMRLPFSAFSHGASPVVDRPAMESSGAVADYSPPGPDSWAAAAGPTPRGREILHRPVHLCQAHYSFVPLHTSIVLVSFF
jgi:hypothetical protein